MPSKNPRCFTVEPIHVPLPGMETINEYGFPFYLFEENELKSTDVGEILAEKIAARLDEYKYDENIDYLVAAGSMTAVLQMVAVAVNMTKTSVKALHYSKRNRRFTPVELG